MKTIKVTLDYKSSDDSLSGKVADRARMSIPFPLQVLDLQGAVLAEGAVDSRQSVNINCDVHADVNQLLVRLLWPTGGTVTQVAEFGGKKVSEVVFSDNNVGPESWAKWSVSRRSSATSSHARKPIKELSPSLGKFKNVWVRLWRHEPSEGWHILSDLPCTQSEESDSLKQFDLELGRASYLLQLGGATMPFTFVSLPGGGPCRVLLTPNVVTDSKSLPLRIVVSGFRPEAEMLAEFLSRDSLQAARSLMADGKASKTVSPWNERDSMSAIVGAYMCLRTGNSLWTGAQGHKFEGFLSRNSWSADAALVGCVAQLREGLKKKADVVEVLDLLKASHQRGVPVFEEAHRLISEATTLLQSLYLISPDEQSKQVPLPNSLNEYKGVLAERQKLAAARAWTGLSFSFFGSTPDNPSPIKLKGAAPLIEDSWQQSGASRTASKGLMFSGSEGVSSLAGIPRVRSRKKSGFTYLKDL